MIKPFSSDDVIVGILAESLALACGMDAVTARQIARAAELHDVGKIHISTAIINKPGDLTPLEFEFVKTHTLWGVYLLSELTGDFKKLAQSVALFHHERWDRQGYWRIPAAKLPLSVQIVSVCDVYVSLTSARSYKHAWPHIEALRYIGANAGTQFNPFVAAVFASLFTTQMGVGK